MQVDDMKKKKKKRKTENTTALMGQKGVKVIKKREIIRACFRF